MQSADGTHVSVVILLADGARPDTLAAALDSGALPALARLRDEGGLHTVTSCFPSVTGPAYAPFLMGRFPGPIGLAGAPLVRPRAHRLHVPRLRAQLRRLSDGRGRSRHRRRRADDLRARATPSLGALNVIGRGLAAARSASGRSRRARRCARRARISRATSRDGSRSTATSPTQVARRVRDERPEFAFAALTGVDKVSHARGQELADDHRRAAHRRRRRRRGFATTPSATAAGTTCRCGS